MLDARYSLAGMGIVLKRGLRMDFGYYLPCYWPDMSYPMQDMYRDMTREAQFAEESGYVSFTIPEHHFTNALVHPNALLSAVHVAAHTKHVPIITATTVLALSQHPVACRRDCAGGLPDQWTDPGRRGQGRLPL